MGYSQGEHEDSWDLGISYFQTKPDIPNEGNEPLNSVWHVAWHLMGYLWTEGIATPILQVLATSLNFH